MPNELPVDPDRLRREFPELSDADVDAYITVTRRILDAGVKDRARVTREVVEGGRKARERGKAGASLSPEDTLSSHYLDAVEKMQRSTSRPR
jgi:hypothetical protein